MSKKISKFMNKKPNGITDIELENLISKVKTNNDNALNLQKKKKQQES